MAGEAAQHIHLDEYHYSTSQENRPKIHQQLITKYADIDHPTADLNKPSTSDTVFQTKFNPGILEDVQPQTAMAAHIQDLPPLDEDLPHIPEPIIQKMLEETTMPIITSIEEPKTPQSKDSDILSIYLSMDVYGSSMNETIAIHPVHSTLGFDLHYNNPNEAPTIKACQSGTPAAKIPKWRSRLRHGTIRAINGIKIDTVQELQQMVQDLKADSTQTECTVMIAHPEIIAPLTSDGIPQLHFDQLHMLAHHLHVLRYGEDENLWDDPSSLPPIDEAIIHQALALDEINLLAKYSRKQLQRRKDWDQWQQGEFKQHDNYETQNMFGPPCPRPKQATVLPFVWSYYFKDEETRKARGTCNGGPRYGKAVTLAYTYAACVEQPAA